MPQNGSNGVPYGNGPPGTTERNLLGLASIAGGVCPRDAPSGSHSLEISQEKAAQVAELDRTDFPLALARERVDACAVNIEDLKHEIDRG